MTAQASNPPSSDVYLVYSTTNSLQHGPTNSHQHGAINELQYGPQRAYRSHNTAAQWCRDTLLQYLQWPIDNTGQYPVPIGANLWKTGGWNSVSGRSASFIIERRQSPGGLSAACTDLYLVCEETSRESHVEDEYYPGVWHLHCIHDIVVLGGFPDMMTASEHRSFEDDLRKGRSPGIAGGVFVKRVSFM